MSYDSICWSKVRAGDKEEIEKAVKRHYKIGYKIAHKWAKNGHIEESEALGLSHIALMKCIDKGTYDETKNITFSAYFGMAVHNEIRMFLRKEKVRKNRASYSLDQIMNVEDENLTYGDLMLSTDTVEDQLEEKYILEDAYEILKMAVEAMTVLELQCFLLYLEGNTPKSISKEKDIPESLSKSLIDSAHIKLQKIEKERRI